MNLNQFVTDAIRTESVIDSVDVNELMLTSTIQALISMGNILDQIKKHVFYGNPYDIQAIRMHFGAAEQAMTTFATLSPSEISDDERSMPVNPRLFHAIIGIATESTELLEALNIYEHDIDQTNVLEEFGDIDWYKAIGIDELGGDWEELLSTIIVKLKARYPEKFTSEDASNRNLTNEREILDGMKRK